MEPDVEIRHLRALIAVGRTGSFSQAAAELNYAQSSISEQIRALESELGTRLLQRTTRSVRLTPAGAALTEYAEQAIELLDRAVQEVKSVSGQGAPTLKIGALETLC